MKIKWIRDEMRVDFNISVSTQFCEYLSLSSVLNLVNRKHYLVLSWQTVGTWTGFGFPTPDGKISFIHTNIINLSTFVLSWKFDFTKKYFFPLTIWSGEMLVGWLVGTESLLPYRATIARQQCMYSYVPASFFLALLI